MDKWGGETSLLKIIKLILVLFFENVPLFSNYVEELQSPKKNLVRLDECTVHNICETTNSLMLKKFEIESDFFYQLNDVK